MKGLILAVVALFCAVTASPSFAGNDSQNGSVHHNTNVTNNNQGGQGGDGGTGVGIGIGKGGNAKSKSNATAISGSKSGAAASGSYANTYSSEAYAPAPSMGTPSLVAAPETCMGSVSAALSGGNGIVGAGVGFGKTYESEQCNRRMNAKYLITFGQMSGDPRFMAAAVLLLAQDENVNKALTTVGVLAAPAIVEATPAAPASTYVQPETDKLKEVQSN